jgi:uncharacterized protein Yka (UPF0111/DUF47 family)
LKSEIIEKLGQGDVLLPSLIGEGLAANDRVKARLSVLQAAAAHAREPEGVRFELTEECRAAGIDPVPLEALVNRASMVSDGRLTAPGLAKLGAAIWDDMTAMLRAVTAGDASAADRQVERLAALKSSATIGASDEIDLAQIVKLTGLSEHDGDSLHRLIMDLHKALNRLAAAQAEETIAGAHAYGLQAGDRPALEAFMRGLNATRKLKFNHPGLETTAIRTATRFIIQNDIGETDAHVVMIAVETTTVRVTYTDVHRARAKFFTERFRNFPVQWSGLQRKSGFGKDGVFYLVTGRLPAANGEGNHAFLEALGASLVFLIDWNKARKTLREWISNADALRVLDWAARHRLGHRGFLELGGPLLVASAVHHAAPARIGFGERLDSALGREAAVDFLKSVLQISTETLLGGSSLRLAQAGIEAALVSHLQGVSAKLLTVTIRQAGLAREIAVDIKAALSERASQQPIDRALPDRARRIEEKADRIAFETRSEIRRFNADRGTERLVNEMEDAIDELEQAAFVASLTPVTLVPVLLDPLVELCSAAVSGAEAAAMGAAAAAEIPHGQRADSDAVLAAVAKLIDAEHRGDVAERAVTASVLTGDFDQKTAFSALELARALERATDRLAMFGYSLREHVLADLST